MSVSTWTSDVLERGDIDAVKRRVLEDATYLSSHDVSQDSPLIIAIQFDHEELVRFMLEHGADLNLEVNDGYTCLLTAIESSTPVSLEIVRTLIEKGADIQRAGTCGWTPLHMAAVRGEVEKARLLIQVGAEVDHRKLIDGEETPLMEAAGAGYPEVVRLLLECGADPSLRDTIQRRTPLEMARYAAQGADEAVCEVLKAQNIKVDPLELFAGMDIPAEQLDMMKSMLKDFDMVENYRQNANRLAQERDYAGVIRVLTEHFSQQ